jgi:RNA polymerase sigma-70 factor, ECF subfamily
MTRPQPAASAAVPTPEQVPAGPVPRPRPGAHPRPSPVPRDAGPAAPPPADGPARTAGSDLAPAPTEDRTEEQLAVWELVRRAQSGDAEGFGELYDRYVDVVFRYLYHRVGDRATAEDFTI